MPVTYWSSTTARRTARRRSSGPFRRFGPSGILRNLGYGASLRTAFDVAINEDFDGLVTLDCDGQHEPARIPELAARLRDADIVSGSRYLRVFDPGQKPPEERRRINVEVTRWLNECLGMNLTDAFCGFKAYRTTALAQLNISDNGYAMPLQVWVQAVAKGMRILEVPVPLIYLDESRAFGGALDDGEYRLKHYRRVFEQELEACRPAHARRVFGMTARLLRAPAHDGGLLVEPVPARYPVKLQPTHTALSEWEHDFQGRRASWLRALVRREVLASARSFLARHGLDGPAGRPGRRERSARVRLS